MVGDTGIEPVTSSVSILSVSQLSASDQATFARRGVSATLLAACVVVTVVVIPSFPVVPSASILDLRSGKHAAPRYARILGPSAGLHPPIVGRLPQPDAVQDRVSDEPVVENQSAAGHDQSLPRLGGLLADPCLVHDRPHELGADHDPVLRLQVLGQLGQTPSGERAAHRRRRPKTASPV